MDKNQQSKEEFHCWHSLIDHNRLHFLIDQCKQVQSAQLQGTVIEIGVYKGGSLARIAQMLPNYQVYGIDTFMGMPKPCERDKHHEGDFKDVDYDSIRKWFNTNYPNVILIKGLFPAIANQIPENQFALVHVDTDLYRSVLDCCKYFFPKLVPGGIMIFDDYGFPTTPGAKQAVDEYFTGKYCEQKIVRIISPDQNKMIPTGQYFVRNIECRF